MTQPQEPPADAKDWTWVVGRACPECGFDPAAVDVRQLPGIVDDLGARWVPVLAEPSAGRRPAPQVWSPLEYGAHVRDVFDLFAARARLIREQDEPRFANWDQDVTARESRYWEADPAQVSAQLVVAAGVAAAAFDAVADAEWDRKGFRSNGSEFTLRTLGLYFAHDVVHHLHDVGAPVGAGGLGS